MSYELQPENSIKVIALDSGFASQLAEIHVMALKGDVLPAMGQHFLESYYEYVLKLPDQLIIGCFENEKLSGFCQVSYTSLSMIKLVMGTPSALLNISRLLFTKPRLFRKGVHQASRRPKKINTLQIPEVTFIAIKQSSQGRGLGKLLIEYVTRHSKKLGVSELFTKTSNEVAKNLYIKHFDAKILASEEIDGNTYWYLIWETTHSDAKY